MVSKSETKFLHSNTKNGESCKMPAKKKQVSLIFKIACDTKTFYLPRKENLDLLDLSVSKGIQKSPLPNSYVA